MRVTHAAAAIDDEIESLESPSIDSRIATSLFDHFLVEVTEEGKIKLLCVGPRLQREEGVDADPEDLGLDLVQGRGRVAQRAQLLRAGTAERGWNERQYHGTALELLAERDRLTILIRQREIWRLGADSTDSTVSLQRLINGE